MRLEFFVVSESVSVDQSTNTLSIFHVIERLGLPEFPAVIPGMAAAALWLIDEGDLGRDWQATLRAAPPGVHEQNIPINFRVVQEQGRHRLIWQLGGVPINREGEFILELLLNGEHQASHVISVVRANPAH